MKKNLGFADKAVRLVLAVALAVLFFTGVVSGTLGVVALTAAGIFLVTPLINFCPLYAALGISTKAK